MTLVRIQSITYMRPNDHINESRYDVNQVKTIIVEPLYVVQSFAESYSRSSECCSRSVALDYNIVLRYDPNVFWCDRPEKVSLQHPDSRGRPFML